MVGVASGLLDRLRSKAGVVQAELQNGSSRSLRRRRWVAFLSSAALVDSVVVALRQMGAVRHLPDPPLRVFDSDTVTTSRAAYIFGTPDAALAAGAYALNLVAASAGGTHRSGRHPLWSLALMLLVTGEAVGAAGYLREMVVRQRRVCPYCLAAIAISFVLLPLGMLNYVDEHRAISRG